MIEIKILSVQQVLLLSSALQELESLSIYPFGPDSFKISHGDSYIAFFQRLGTPQFHLAFDGTKIIACAAGVLRTILIGDKEVKVWYMCDLKVHPDYQRHHIPSKLFKKNVFLNYLKCSRGYAISMNPSDRPNRVIKILKQFPYFPISLLSQLDIFSLDFNQIQKILPQLKDMLGPIGFLSLNGKKDLIILKTGEKLNLLHIQYGNFAENQYLQPAINSTHMICATPQSALGQFLNTNFTPSATASILGHRMNKIPLDFILTSDI